VNKTELIEQVARTADITQASASRAVDAIFGAIANSLRSGEPVMLTGFGSFSVSERAARNGRNPRIEEPQVQSWQRPEGCPKLTPLRGAPSGSERGLQL
jgi:DNA-binding protein HU-beta